MIDISQDQFDMIKQLKTAVFLLSKGQMGYGKSRGNAGGWKAEKEYQVASTRLHDFLYNLLIATKRKKDGSYFTNQYTVEGQPPEV